MNARGVEALLATVLTGAPTLPEAACRGMAPMFDAELPGETVDERESRLGLAVRTCRSCPELGACTGLLAGLPARHQVGVMAARVLTGGQSRPAA